MLEEKKTQRANIESRRTEIFLVALVLILSCLLTALEWDASMADMADDEPMEDLIEDIDIRKLKKDHDMVVAISHTDNPAEVTNVKPSEMIASSSQTHHHKQTRSRRRASRDARGESGGSETAHHAGEGRRA